MGVAAVQTHPAGLYLRDEQSPTFQLVCQKQELQAMAFIFQATAKQEQAHAKVFWDHLQALNGQNLPIYGAYPFRMSVFRY